MDFTQPKKAVVLGEAVWTMKQYVNPVTDTLQQAYDETITTPVLDAEGNDTGEVTTEVVHHDAVMAEKPRYGTVSCSYIALDTDGKQVGVVRGSVDDLTEAQREALITMAEEHRQSTAVTTKLRAR